MGDVVRESGSSAQSSPTIVQQPSPDPNDFVIKVEEGHEDGDSKEKSVDDDQSRTAIDRGIRR